MNEINYEEAMSLVDRLGPSLGYDNTYYPMFPITRKDVCVVQRLAENGTSYGFDTLYLLWKTDEKLNHLKIDDTKFTKNYMSVDKILENEKNIIVKYNGDSAGLEYIKSKKELNLE